jgi:methyl coenzyme M reductase subunit D
MDLYWNTGRIIIENTKYGARFIENLSKVVEKIYPKSFDRPLKKC